MRGTNGGRNVLPVKDRGSSDGARGPAQSYSKTWQPPTQVAVEFISGSMVSVLRQALSTQHARNFAIARPAAFQSTLFLPLIVAKV